MRTQTSRFRYALPLLFLSATLPVVLDRIDGDETDETLHGTPQDDTIHAHGGNDIVHAYAGNDTVDGGEGNDTLFLGDGDDLANGGAGNDLVHGGKGADFLSGGAGNDEMHGDAGDDRLEGGDGADVLDGGAHEDFVDGGGGDDTLASGRGGGVVHGGPGNDVIELGQSFGAVHEGYPRFDDPDFDFQRIVAEGYGDTGNDWIKSRPTAVNGASFHYLDGGEGRDVLDGGRGQDLLVLRGGDDTVITGESDDYIAIVGNSVEGYTFYDHIDYHPDGTPVLGPSGEPQDHNRGSDMLCFVRDVNPQQLTLLSVFYSGSVKHFLEYDGGLATTEPVTLDLPNLPQLHNIEAFRTGSGDDTIIGTDRTGADFGFVATYNNRWHGPMDPQDPNKNDNYSWLRVEELFFTGAGDDTITTGLGNDLVDASSGDDTLHVGPGNCFLLTGPGHDTVHFRAEEFDGGGASSPLGARCRIADLSTDDQVLVEGATASQVTLELQSFPNDPRLAAGYAGTSFTSVRFEGTEEFVLLGLSPRDLEVSDVSGRVRITTRRSSSPRSEGPPRPFGGSGGSHSK